MCTFCASDLPLRGSSLASSANAAGGSPLRSWLGLSRAGLSRDGLCRAGLRRDGLCRDGLAGLGRDTGGELGLAVVMPTDAKYGLSSSSSSLGVPCGGLCVRRRPWARPWPEDMRGERPAGPSPIRARCALGRHTIFGPKSLAFAHFLPAGHAARTPALHGWQNAHHTRSRTYSPAPSLYASRDFRPKLRILYAAFRLSIEALA